MMYCLTEEEYRNLKNPIEIQKAYNEKVRDLIAGVNGVFNKHSLKWNKEVYLDLKNAIINVTPHSSVDGSPEASGTSQLNQ